MDNYSYNLENNIDKKEVSENMIAGIVGAFLFSLAGGILWFVFYMLGFIAGISGLIGVVCAIKGYSIFAKKESTKGIIISVIITLLVMVLAWYLCLGYDIYMVHQEWFASGEIDYTYTFFESVRIAPEFLLIQESEIISSYLIDLGLGLLLCIVGGGSYVYNKIKRSKQNPNVEVNTSNGIGDTVANNGDNNYYNNNIEE